MTNKLKEIQKENRKFITDKNFVIKGELLTFNRVLMVFDNLACDLRISNSNESWNIVFIRLDWPMLFVGGFYWDLTKETLEEQSEKTQEEVNRIINLT